MMKILPTDSDLAEIYRLASDTRSPYVRAELMRIGERVLVRSADRYDSSRGSSCGCTGIAFWSIVNLPAIVLATVERLCSMLPFRRAR